MWKTIRIAILLVVLVVVIMRSWQEKADLDWKNSFYVAAYPVNVENSLKVANYIQTLHASDFEPVSTHLNIEAKRYGINLYRPINIVLGQPLEKVPPAPPTHDNPLQVILWSLKIRFFAWQHKQDFQVSPQIQLYLLYFDPATHPSLSHSTALQKGRVGRINLFGEQSYDAQNLVILSHELLHTLGATDKYNLSTTLPLFPDGYADPKQLPLYPQTRAELMGGRIAVNPNKASIPKNLEQTIVGPKTAQEIGWLK